ncbi:MAG: hypothetical protein R2731_01070 [Nocardioides sp.]
MRVWRRSNDSPSTLDATAIAMDGKVVGRAGSKCVPSCAAGFSQFTDRKACRETEHTIDHVTFRSMNAYNAGVFGCPSYSVTVEVGVFYRCLDPELTKPQDYNCTFRAILGKTIRQPFFVIEWGPAADRPEILYVKSDGTNLGEVVQEAKHILEAQGLPFMDHFNQPDRAFNSLMTERMTDGDFGKPRVMFPGNPDSPNWRETSLNIGHLIMDDPRAATESAPIVGAG